MRGLFIKVTFKECVRRKGFSWTGLLKGVDKSLERREKVRGRTKRVTSKKKKSLFENQI